MGLNHCGAGEDVVGLNHGGGGGSHHGAKLRQELSWGCLMLQRGCGSFTVMGTRGCCLTATPGPFLVPRVSPGRVISVCWTRLSHLG